VVGGKSTTSTEQKTSYVSDSRSYGADDGSIAAGGSVVVQNTEIDAEAVGDAFAFGQAAFDRALDSVDVLTDSFGQVMVSREKSAGDSVRLANEAALDAINAAQPESEKTIMVLAVSGVAGLAAIALFLRGAKK